MELSPRPSATPGVPQGARRRTPWVYGVLLLVALGLGVVVYQGLNSASLYFYNADEAVQQRQALSDRRFRLQGTVQEGTVTTTGNGVTFTVAHNGVDVLVRHQGDPPELFQPGIPVVLEGRWAAAGDEFDSDLIRVKHSEQYVADNGDRIEDAEDGQSADVRPSPRNP